MTSPAASTKVTFYEELGVPRDASQDDIKKAYKKKALEVHPDKNPDEEKELWEEKFKHLQQIHETLSNEQSRKVYDEKHLREERTGRVLILMDMNGSLLCKVSKRERCSYRGSPDFEDKDNYFFVRPHAKEFLEGMLHPNSNIYFAIYTSRQPHNAGPQVQQLFKATQCSHLQRSVFSIYAGDMYSVPDPEAGPYKSKRCLRKIWNDQTCTRRGIKFDMCNTVNLDNEISKLKDHLRNGIRVPGYTDRSLGRKDEVLVRLKDYLLRLAKESHGDVREYMELFPFSTEGPVKFRSLPPVSEFLMDDEEQVDEIAQRITGLSLREPAEARALRPGSGRAPRGA